jgi:hypothetical protein
MTHTLLAVAYLAARACSLLVVIGAVTVAVEWLTPPWSRAKKIPATPK